MIQIEKIDREFAVGDWVYLRLQPFRQSSLPWCKNLKSSPKFYGPFQITHCIGVVAYKLDLGASSRIHPVFHVSALKQQLGSRITTEPSCLMYVKMMQLVLHFYVTVVRFR